MEIKKHFKDIGSIIKALLNHINLNIVYIKVCTDPSFPGQICVAIMSYTSMCPVIFYTWDQYKVQTLFVPDEICLPHVLKPKVMRSQISKQKLKNTKF